jgi:ABC-type uncharacterized transport system permease subunit
MEFLQKISLTCFTASYLVVFALEMCRVFLATDLVRSKRFQLLIFLATTAGLFAHSAFLAHHGGLGTGGFWVGHWFGWCLVGSWVLVIAYLWIFIRQPGSVMGLFIFPAVLGLILFGSQFSSTALFTSRHIRSGWNMVHGGSLLLGTVIVALGCVFGIVYLVQSYRLKRKFTSASWLRLPSLEWLQRSAESSLLTSAVLLGIGLMSGVIIAQSPLRETSGEPATGGGSLWWDPVVWTSAILFAWLVLATTFSLCYRPARQGRKVAYLVMASFLFLMLELLIVWWMGHAMDKSEIVLTVTDSGKPLESPVGFLFQRGGGR